MLPRLLRGGIVAALWIAVWAAAAALVGQTLLLPSPLSVGQSLLALSRRGDFWLAIGMSMLRILEGFALGAGIGCALASLTSRYPWCRAFFAPMLSTIKATPVASFILLALVWVKSSGVPAFATSLVVLPVTWANVSAGIEGVDGNLLEMGRAFRMPRRTLLAKIYWPSARPYFYAAATTGMGMAWKAGIAAEVICLPRSSLGGFLYNTKIYLDTPGLFATTAVVILLSVALELCVKRATRLGQRTDGAERAVRHG